MKRIGNNGTTAIAEVPAVEKRMGIGSIKESESSKAEKIILYAPEGWGKSTWASKSEKSVFLCPEDGLKNIKVQSFPEPKSWGEIFEAVETLRHEEHDFKTLVIDTADWTEHLCHKFLVERDGMDSIEAYGYGKGYVLAFEEWKRLLSPLNALRREKEMSIIFLAHAAIKTFNNPEGENYDRYEMKTDKRVAALLREWADCVLFGIYDVAVDKKKGYGGERRIYANHSSAYEAKNRYGIEKPLSADFMEFWSHVRPEVTK